MSESYKTVQDANNIRLLREVQKNLPEFTRKYFTSLVANTGAVSTRTILGYARDLDTFFFFLSETTPKVNEAKQISPEILNKLKPLDIEEYLVFLTQYERDGKQHKNSVSSKNRKLSALRTFWMWHERYGILESNPLTLVRNIKDKGKKPVITVSHDEIPDVYENISEKKTLTEQSKKVSEKTKKRDLAIISLMLGTGLRVSECVGIDVGDLDLKENSVLVDRKGGERQKVYFNETVAGNLRDYLDNERLVPADGSSALFVSRIHTRLGVRAVEKLVLKYADPVAGGHITPHKLRSTYATELYNKTHDIYLVKDALNHAQISSTEHYAAVNDQRRKEAANYTDELS